MKIKRASVSALAMLACCFLFVSCGDGNDNITSTEPTEKTWFTEEELKIMHLSELPAPIDCTGTGNASTFWFNDGYSYSIPCPSQEILTKNADRYFNYFKENYNNSFGIQKLFGTGDATMYYKIVFKDTLSDYFGDNPCPLYKFYYATDSELTDDGFLKDDSVYSFEMRFDLNTDTSEYQLKLFMEKANKSRNGTYTFKYKLAA